MTGLGSNRSLTSQTRQDMATYLGGSHPRNVLHVAMATHVNSAANEAEHVGL